MTNYHTKEYINGESPYWLFFRDDVLRICRAAGVDEDIQYQVVFYLNDWFYQLEQEVKDGEASENGVKFVPKVIEAVLKIFEHNYTDEEESFKLKKKLVDVKETVSELSEMLKDD